MSGRGDPIRGPYDHPAVGTLRPLAFPPIRGRSSRAATAIRCTASERPTAVGRARATSDAAALGEGSDFLAVHESFRRLDFTSAPQLVSVRGQGKGREMKRVLSGVVVPTFVGLMSCGVARLDGYLVGRGRCNEATVDPTREHSRRKDCEDRLRSLMVVGCGLVTAGGHTPTHEGGRYPDGRSLPLIRWSPTEPKIPNRTGTFPTSGGEPRPR